MGFRNNCGPYNYLHIYNIYIYIYIHISTISYNYLHIYNIYIYIYIIYILKTSVERTPIADGLTTTILLIRKIHIVTFSEHFIFCKFIQRKQYIPLGEHVRTWKTLN